MVLGTRRVMRKITGGRKDTLALLTVLWHQPGSFREHPNLQSPALALFELLMTGVWHMEYKSAHP